MKWRSTYPGTKICTQIGTVVQIRMYGLENPLHGLEKRLKKGSGGSLLNLKSLKRRMTKSNTHWLHIHMGPRIALRRVPEHSMSGSRVTCNENVERIQEKDRKVNENLGKNPKTLFYNERFNELHFEQLLDTSLEVPSRREYI